MKPENNDTAMRELLRAVLNSQEQDEEVGTISKERLLEFVTKKANPTPEEKRILWLSPRERARYFEVKDDWVRDFIQANWIRLGIDTEYQLRGALCKKKQASIWEIDHEYYHVTITPGKGSFPARVEVKIKPELLQTFPPQHPIALVDGGGHCWVQGVPDERGRIVQTWHFPEDSLGISPFDRLRSVGTFFVRG